MRVKREREGDGKYLGRALVDLEDPRIPQQLRRAVLLVVPGAAVDLNTLVGVGARDLGSVRLGDRGVVRCAGRTRILRERCSTDELRAIALNR